MTDLCEYCGQTNHERDPRGGCICCGGRMEAPIDAGEMIEVTTFSDPKPVFIPRLTLVGEQGPEIIAETYWIHGAPETRLGVNTILGT